MTTWQSGKWEKPCEAALTYVPFRIVREQVLAGSCEMRKRRHFPEGGRRFGRARGGKKSHIRFRDPASSITARQRRSPSLEMRVTRSPAREMPGTLTVEDAASFARNGQ